MKFFLLSTSGDYRDVKRLLTRCFNRISL